MGSEGDRRFESCGAALRPAWHDDRARFDPVAAGAHHGLSAARSAALWAQLAAGDGIDVEALTRQFHARAARLVPRPGKATLAAAPWQVARDDAAAPGRTTRVAVAGQAARDDAAAVPGRTALVVVAGQAALAVSPWQVARDAEAAVPGRPARVALAAASLVGRGAVGIAQPVMRSAEAAPGELDARTAELIARARVGGAPLGERMRSRLEATFGVRLDSARVHTGPAANAAARAVGARAFAVGDDLVFRDGAYDPDSRDGQRLIAHEVAHTVQARGGTLAGARAVSQPDDAPEREADRLAEAFVDESDGSPAPAPALAPPADLAPAPAGVAPVLRKAAAPAPAPPHDSAAARKHPGEPPEVAAAYDAFVDGVYAAAARIVRDNEHAVEAWCDFVLVQLPPEQMAGQVFATGFTQLEDQAQQSQSAHLIPQYANEANPVRQELLEQQIAGAWRACTGCHVAVQASAIDTQMHALHDPGRTPAELLRGYADGGGHAAAPARAIGAAGAAAALASVHAALARLQPMLQPLGDAGYKILPSNLISRFGAAPLPQLRAELQAAFDRRVSGYEALLARIQDRGLDYLELDALVAARRDTASDEVRALIAADERLRQRQRIVRFVGMLVVDLLSIVVPPLGLVAGALHVASGVAQFQTGTDRTNATGAHAAMSPERQASGPAMRLGGAMEAVGGAVQAGTTAAGLRATPAAARPAQTRVGPYTLEPLENGTLRVTHADYPGTSIVVHPDGTVVGYDHLGSVVGTTQLGGPRGAGPSPGPSGTVLAGRSPSTAIAPRSPATAVSPFRTGGIGAGSVEPTQWNPSGRDDNCGFTSISYAVERFSAGRVKLDADHLYHQTRQQLGVAPDEALSPQLAFPAPSFDGLKARPGYEPLFNTDGNRVSEYTLPRVAQSFGLQGTVKSNLLSDWNTTFAKGGSLDAAVEARLAYLERRGQHPAPEAVRGWVEKLRKELSGFYIIGSHGSSHFMTLTIEPGGKLTGFDPQTHTTYSTMDEVVTRMSGSFEFSFKVTGYTPPAQETK